MVSDYRIMPCMLNLVAIDFFILQTIDCFIEWYFLETRRSLPQFSIGTRGPLEGRYSGRSLMLSTLIRSTLPLDDQYSDG